MASLDFLDGEKWKVVSDCPDYLVSNMGRVFSLKSNSLLLPDTKRNLYASFTLKNKNGNRKILAHRLVYETFIGPIPRGLVINHKDECKTNNTLSNLEIVTQSQNAKYGTANNRRIETHRNTAKITGTWNGCEKPCMNVETGNVYSSVKEAAAQTNGKRTSISNVCTGFRKTYRGERWIYINKEDYYARNHGME
jgi:hypothetical protein